MIDPPKFLGWSFRAAAQHGGRVAPPKLKCKSLTNITDHHFIGIRAEHNKNRGD
jgi:hypothetical protein